MTPIELKRWSQLQLKTCMWNKITGKGAVWLEVLCLLLMNQSVYISLRVLLPLMHEPVHIL